MLMLSMSVLVKLVTSIGDEKTTVNATGDVDGSGVAVFWLMVAVKFFIIC